MKLSEYFEATKQVLVDRGWNQGWSGDTERGPVCLAHASGLVPEATLEQRSLFLAWMQAQTGHAVATWNDAPERTLEEVYEALHQAIDAAEAYGV